MFLMLNNINLNPLKVLAYGSFFAIATAYSVQASDSSLTSDAHWQPLASDTLIRLPGAIIEKRIVKDFDASPLAMRIATLDNDMNESVANIKELQVALKKGNEDRQQLRFSLIQEKSDYLDLLQESHALQQQGLSQKQVLYKEVLEKLQNQSGKNRQSESYKIKKAQQAALIRMQKVTEQLDTQFTHLPENKGEGYDGQYTNNLAHIEQLKSAIAKHKSNAMALKNGQMLDGEEYVRQLLMDTATEQSLLDQEGLMLGYMAKLVALDAQSLEFDIADNEKPNASSQPSRPANISSLFYEE